MAAIGRVLLIPKGDYSGSTAYNALDWVRNNGAAWVCKVDNTIGIAPPTLPTTSNANWQLLSADGTVSGSIDWSNVNNKPFNSVGSGLNVNVSNEIELDTTMLTASNISYDNTGSGAASIDVQAAIDELFAGGGGGGLSNAFDEVDVGGVSLAANGGDTLYLLAGSNITLTPNSATNEVTITASGGGGGGGHTMLPNPASSPSEADCINAINTAVAAGSTNDSVASEYTIGKWSNSFEKVAIVKATSAHPISTTGIGTWQDTLNSPTKADEQGWGWIEWSALHGIGSDNVDVKLTFDPDKCSVPITLGGYIIDDANDMMCIKFGNEITSADTETAWVGIKIIITRTAATDITP